MSTITGASASTKNPTFSDNFNSFDPTKWYYNSFDEGGDAFWTNNPSVTGSIYSYSNGILNVGLLPTPAGSGITTKPYISGIMDTYNVNGFAQQYGYFEDTVAVDRVVGFEYDCVMLSPVNFPPDFTFRIRTDANNDQHVDMFAYDSSNIYWSTDSAAGFDASAYHAYGLNWTATNIEFYIDRVLVAHFANPGGAYTNGDAIYSKMCVNANFGPYATPIANPSALPAYAHVDSYNIWASMPLSTTAPPPSPTPTPSPAATPVIIGSGPDSLVLQISEDAFVNADGASDAAGDATFTVSVDGKQQGGTLTTTASHAAGASQSFTFDGYFGTGPHNVAVTFVNDAYNPSAPDASGSVDRNLYVDDVAYKGADTKQTAAFYSGGAQTFTVTGGTAQPAPTPAPVTTGSGSDRLVLRMSEDAYQGDAQFTVSVDGKQQGGTLTASAGHSTGDSNVFVLTGSWGAGAHDVKLQFTNDAYGGTAATDRNLYVNSIGYDGVTYSNTAASMWSNGTRNFAVGGTVAAATAPADTLTVHLAEDAWNGNAQFVLTIDGKQISTPQDVVALHSSGAWQDLTFAGNFGAGSHTVGVKFTNDAYGGTPATDRNLYVNGVDCNGQHYGSGITALWNNEAATFTIATTH